MQKIKVMEAIKLPRRIADLDIPFKEWLNNNSIELPILKTNSSNGRYAIHLSQTESKFFFSKKEANNFLNTLIV